MNCFNFNNKTWIPLYYSKSEEIIKDFMTTCVYKRRLSNYIYG